MKKALDNIENKTVELYICSVKAYRLEKYKNTEIFMWLLNAIEKMLAHLQSMGEPITKFNDAKKHYIDYFLSTDGGIHPELALHISMPPTNKKFIRNGNTNLVFDLPPRFSTAKS